MTKKELTKDKIRQAAFNCVAKYGFEKTNLDDIAKEVGLNKTSLYYYYTNKEEIFLDITTTATRRFYETLKTSTLNVSGGIGEQVKHFLKERALYYVRMIQEVHISESTLRQVEHLFFDQIKDIKTAEKTFLKQLLEDAQNNGEIKCQDPSRLADNFIALSESVKHLAKEKHPNYQDVALISNEIQVNIEFMVKLIIKGLG